MKLQNGFEIQGNINLNPIYLNNEWTQVLTVESVLQIEALRELFKDNNIIVEVNGDSETAYYTKGLIDIKSENDKSYVWLYFDYSYNKNINIESIRKENEMLKGCIIELADIVYATTGSGV